MNFFADQDVYASTIRLLTGLDHDLVLAASIGMARATDTEILQAAHTQDRILITRDRGFGGLVFVLGNSAGVIFLRMMPSTIHQVHAELARVLTLYDESFLKTSFIVVEPARHRVRRLSSAQNPGP